MRRALLSLGILLLAGLAGAELAHPDQAAQDLEDWVDDGNVASPGRQPGQANDKQCGPVSAQLQAREAQVNELLGKESKLEGSLSAAQRRLHGLETQLKELREANQKSSSTSDSARASKAETELAALKAKLQESEETLQAQRSECGKTTSALQQAQGKVDALAGDLDASKAALKKLADSNDLSSRADKKALKEAQASLSRAQADASTANEALSKAQQDVLGSLQALDDWAWATLPAWAATQYGKASAAAAPSMRSLSEAAQPYWDQASEALSPHTSVVYEQGSKYGKAGWDTGSKYASQAYQVGGKYANSAYLQGSKAYSSGKKVGLEAYAATHPYIRKAWLQVKAFLHKVWVQTRTTLGPHLSTGSASLERGMRSVRQQLHQLTAHPQLVQLKRGATSAWAEVEDVIAQGLARVPQLKPYARRPYSTNLLYLLLSVPLLLLAVSLLVATQVSNKPLQRGGAKTAASSAESDLPAGVKSSPGSSAAATKRKPKAKQYTEGGESVVYK